MPPSTFAPHLATPAPSGPPELLAPPLTPLAALAATLQSLGSAVLGAADVCTLSGVGLAALRLVTLPAGQLVITEEHGSLVLAAGYRICRGWKFLDREDLDHLDLGLADPLDL